MIFLFVAVSIFHCDFAHAGGNFNYLTEEQNEPEYRPGWYAFMLLPSDFFGYEKNNGPHTWAEYYPNCGGSRQSPIDIETDKLVRKKTKLPLEWQNFENAPDKMYVENSLHSIHVTGVWYNPTQRPYISKGPLSRKYHFAQLHFHWSQTKTNGSEHRVNGKSFDLEGHMVFSRVDYRHINTSVQGSGTKFVVVGNMFQRTKKDNVSFQPILLGTKQVKGHVQKKTRIEPFPMINFIEPFKNDYVVYKGSLTTPPCTENVVWIINSRPYGISPSQLRVFQKSIIGSDGKHIQNIRPVQFVNSRKVHYVYC